MECVCCKSETEEKMVLLASPGGKVRLVKELGKNKYERGIVKDLVAYVCSNCGHVELSIKK